KFTKAHEWIKVEGDVAAVGISDYAQKELGDVVYVELPTVGDSFAKEDPCSNIESVKAVSDVYSPLTGEITEANEALEDAPETINKSPYEDGWIFKIKVDDAAELDEYMSNVQYDEYLKGLTEE
ncbi:MAG: glycine cleavage system protein GcvH, partial [bacterium]|nr:glycine cleavage system protein GcvH [bacterium]